MRWTAAFIPTLRDDPADAEAVSHKLLVRGGFIRQLASGTYSLLPLGHRVAKEIEAILRFEMEKIGGQEFTLPALHPAALWKQSGRWDAIDATMFRLKDRHGADACLGMTHEEVFTSIAKELRSYRQLPQTWFQFQTKFRDEERPKSGLLRVREFVMKDGCAQQEILQPFGEIQEHLLRKIVEDRGAAFRPGASPEHLQPPIRRSGR